MRGRINSAALKYPLFSLGKLVDIDPAWSMSVWRKELSPDDPPWPNKIVTMQRTLAAKAEDGFARVTGDARGLGYGFFPPLSWGLAASSFGGGGSWGLFSPSTTRFCIVPPRGSSSLAVNPGKSDLEGSLGRTHTFAAVFWGYCFWPWSSTPLSVVTRASKTGTARARFCLGGGRQQQTGEEEDVD
ncbi:hypothetical protein CISG_01261 [Coccidioides immitis RMSCC 3703]|uniref:Uncharacterized protein n=2 Tax=Coccidioides immitis TaxID=5501 RepID=A0A0J8QYR9_COCIT|nr:hypothetical protein CIRG_01637 [Coccidioides immitis RMSCC 2394]KMU76528.1 hypothetical protein CISG_01261 [Coccidioides immitis RMSCC 3703]